VWRVACTTWFIQLLTIDDVHTLYDYYIILYYMFLMLRLYCTRVYIVCSLVLCMCLLLFYMAYSRLLSCSYSFDLFCDLITAVVHRLQRVCNSTHGHCDNYNLKSYRLCNDMSCLNLSGYVGHVTIFIWMCSIACSLVVGLWLGLGLGLNLASGW